MPLLEEINQFHLKRRKMKKIQLKGLINIHFLLMDKNKKELPASLQQFISLKSKLSTRKAPSIQLKQIKSNRN